jgi:alpha-tubulin suppressor-like RCC1 family protein
VAVLDNATGKAITGATSVSTGNAFACAVISGGTVKCWGQNTSGQLGDGTKVTRTRAVTVLASAGVPLKGVTAVAAGGNTACARLSTGAVRCWGSNSNGQLGRGNVVSSSVPVAVVGLDGVAAKATVVTVGSAHACAVVAGGAVRCWGANSSGQLGDGTTTQRLSPVAVKVSAAAALSGATTVTAGAAHSCAIVGPIASATVRCWGSGANGRLGSGLTSSSVARLVSGTVATKAIAVAAGGAHSVVIGPNPAFAGNGISGWGLNSSGQVGDGTASSRSVPTRSPTL